MLQSNNMIKMLAIFIKLQSNEYLGFKFSSIFSICCKHFFLWKRQGKRACGSPDGKWSPPPTTPYNTRGAIGALPADKIGWALEPGITWCETQWHMPGVVMTGVGPCVLPLLATWLYHMYKILAQKRDKIYFKRIGGAYRTFKNRILNFYFCKLDF